MKDDWILRFRPPTRESRVRLFCLPYAGGGASAYFQWRELLPSFVDLCAVQLPGREGRISHELVTSSHRVVAQIADALEPLLDRSFALFGHSMGALLAFEVARALRGRWQPAPLALFLSACRAPNLLGARNSIHLLPDDRFLDEVERLGGTPPGVLADAEMMSLILPKLRADITLCETYRFSPGPPLAVPIWTFGGLEDPEVTRDELAAWAAHTSKEFRLQLFPGDHFFLHSQRCALLVTIASALEMKGAL